MRLFCSASLRASASPTPYPWGELKIQIGLHEQKQEFNFQLTFVQAAMTSSRMNQPSKNENFYVNYPLPKNKRKNCHTVTLVPVQYLACVAAGPRTRQNHLYSSIQKVWSVCDAGNLVPSSKRKAFEVGKAIGDNKQ